ncbi:hypothetical protein MXD62_28790 [Frankia sp. Mgl5]|uniref:hypothetical protein n=1 Tax=Frankia sp. Mgl5 TaxID=2933793 RepID=UPI00200E747D|nr:hypothetical protein [Frankia sp. Mgl5]MCK9931095.1 hypothetical protein [Frankia sp. Mgl5]
MVHALSFLVVLLAAAGAVAGLFMRTGSAAGPAVSDTAAVGGLVATAGEADWASLTSHHMDTGDGYQMPAQMMPGAPEGDNQRLGITLHLTNAGSEVRRFDLANEFTLAGGGTTTALTPHSDTFGALSRLNPDSAVNGVVYFDTQAPRPDDPPFELLWRRDGTTHRLLVRLPGAPAQHEHGAS